MKLIILSMLVVTSMAAPAAQSLTFLDDGSYRFFYETGKEGGSHTRTEVRKPDGVVIGRFSYEDPDGELREVNYRADNAGFMAQGDVSVQGAPKGQFPVPQEDQQPGQDPSATPVKIDEYPEEPKGEESQKHRSVEPNRNDQPPAEFTDDDTYHHDEDEKEDIQDLALEESSANDPPEAFPPGFFFGKFQGLRRFPEPTKEPTTTEAPKKVEKQSQEEKQPQSENAKKATEDKKDAASKQPTGSGDASKEGSVFSFAPLNPLPALGLASNPMATIPHIPHIPHQEWASAMFHQPVYVFSYHQPDSYGYHYYY